MKTFIYRLTKTGKIHYRCVRLSMHKRTKKRYQKTNRNHEPNVDSFLYEEKKSVKIEKNNVECEISHMEHTLLRRIRGLERKCWE